MTQQALIIGGGTSELVAAHYLASAGYRVLLLDPHMPPENALLSWGWVPNPIIEDLSLAAHGLQFQYADPWLSAPLPGGGRVDLFRDPASSAASIAKISANDATKWPRFCERMARLARLLEHLYLTPPPDPMSTHPGDLAQLAGIAFQTRLLGREGLEDLLRLLPMSAADFLDDWFETDALKGMLGAGGIMNLHRGPRSGGTAFALLHHHVGSSPGVFRPPRSNLGTVLARLPGIGIRHGDEVAHITVQEGRAKSVVLASGEEIAAQVILSGADPRRTLLEWVDPGWLDPELVRAVRHIRSRGVAARVELVLEQAPGFQSLALAPSLDYLERAYDDAKYRGVSQSPYVEAYAEAGADGRHRVSVHVQYAPYALAEGTWDRARCDALGDLAVQLLSADVPDFASTVIERSVLSPLELEKFEGWLQGQACQAELALDQVLWMRPVPELARYRTPIPGLYLCGPAMHPGIAAACGRNAARQVMKDLRR